MYGCFSHAGTLYEIRICRLRRNEKTAAASEIKAAAYSPDDVLALFSAFQQQAGEALLFLKNLRTVAFYERDDAASAPRLLYRMRLSVPEVPQLRT